MNLNDYFLNKVASLLHEFHKINLKDSQLDESAKHQ